MDKMHNALNPLLSIEERVSRLDFYWLPDGTPTCNEGECSRKKHYHNRPVPATTLNIAIPRNKARTTCEVSAYTIRLTCSFHAGSFKRSMNNRGYNVTRHVLGAPTSGVKAADIAAIIRKDYDNACYEEQQQEDAWLKRVEDAGPKMRAAHLEPATSFPRLDVALSTETDDYLRVWVRINTPRWQNTRLTPAQARLVAEELIKMADLSEALTKSPI